MRLNRNVPLTIAKIEVRNSLSSAIGTRKTSGSRGNAHCIAGANITTNSATKIASIAARADRVRPVSDTTAAR